MIECIRFKSYEKGALQGFADLYVEKWGLELNGCSLYMRDGQRWINLPSKEYKDKEGETKYSPAVRFRDKEHFQAFAEKAKAAIDKFCKESQQDSGNLASKDPEFFNDMPF